MKRFYAILFCVGLAVGPAIPTVIFGPKKHAPRAAEEAAAQQRKDARALLQPKANSEWRGNYADALQAARSGPVLLIVHKGGAVPRGDAFELDLRDYKNQNQRAKVARYFTGPYPAEHTLQLHAGRVKSSRFCRSN